MRINYKEKKLLSEEQTKSKEIEFAVEKAKLQLDADILSTEEAIEESNSELEEIKTTYPLDTKKYVEIKWRIFVLERYVSDLKELKNECGF